MKIFGAKKFLIHVYKGSSKYLEKIYMKNLYMDFKNFCTKIKISFFKKRFIFLFERVTGREKKK